MDFGLGGGGGGGGGTDFCTAKMCLGAKEKVWDIIIQFLQLVLCYGVTFSGV